MAQACGQTTADSISSGFNSINIDVLPQIEKELDPNDLVALVFLLYDDPDTALQRLIVFQRVSSGERDMNLLYDWAHQAQTRPSWRQEFLEALAVCQIYNVVRNLGFQVSAVKKHYLPDNIHVNVHVNPMKKALYKLCENITVDNLRKLQNTLKTYDLDTTEHNYCEVVFLELICKKFIIVDNNKKIQIGNLAKIIDNIGELKKFATDLRKIQDKFNNEPSITSKPISTSSTLMSPVTVDVPNDEDKFTQHAFEELYKYIDQQIMDDILASNIKSDTNKLIEGGYPIINPERVGVCYIINQEEFHPSKDSIERKISSCPLDKRLGSKIDKAVLTETMEALKFEVICSRNLGHKQMLDNIKSIVQYRVQPDHSVFMLCILSHGVKGHIYAADSVMVKVETIQNLLDKCFQDRHLFDMPKVMIIQACQVNIDDEPHLSPTLVADSPTSYFMRKSHFLIYWATAPELEAYRNEIKGSIFIQVLCLMIQKYAKHEHLYDIFTKVNDGVAYICAKKECVQVPIFETTLRKKLYLIRPKLV